MGNAQLSACLPPVVARGIGLPTSEDIFDIKFEAARAKMFDGIRLLGDQEKVSLGRISRCEAEIRSRARHHDKTGAMSAFKAKKSNEKSLDKTRTTRIKLENMIDALVQSRYNEQLHTVLEECTSMMTLSIKKTDVDTIEDTMDNLAQVHQMTEEISEALARPIEDMGDLDGDDEDPFSGKTVIEAELEAFLKSPEPEVMPQVPVQIKRPPEHRYIPPLTHPLSGATTLVSAMPSVPVDRIMVQPRRSQMGRSVHHNTGVYPGM